MRCSLWLGFGFFFAAGCGARTDLARFDPDAGQVDALAPECLRDDDCDDRFDCTEDRCDARVCQHRPRSERCDDGSFCTGAGLCEVGRGCVFAGDPCDDGVLCTIDRCDEERDLCTAEPSADLCPLSHRCDSSRGCIARAIVHDNDWLYEVDLPSGEINTLTPARRRFTDVSLHPDGRLFAITTGELFLL
ncbi:MAG TPA: hypothetical protein ENK57_19500, partial [Polyangiaceae bacterium]|nr:hypothetical protein [Polyangiaceae bacterium]